MKKKILVVPLVLLLAVSVVAIGCPPPVPVNDVVVPPPPVIEWIAQSFWPAGFGLHICAEEWARRVGEISGGRLEVTMHPAGALVPVMDMFDATAVGVLDAAHSWPPFWFGKDPAFLLFCGHTVGMTKLEYAVWLFQFGGWELMQELYAPFNVFPMPVAAGGAEPFIWATKPIRTMEDLEGLKIRTSGLALEILGGMGTAALFLPAGEIVPAMKKGVIDAADFTTIWTDVPMGFHEVAPYLVIGKDRAPSYTLEVLIHLDSWKALPEDLRQVVIAAATETHFRSIARSEWKSAKGLEYLKAFGTVITHVDEEVLAELRRVRDIILDAYAAECPFFARVLESQREFLERYRTFTDLFHSRR